MNYFFSKFYIIFSIFNFMNQETNYDDEFDTLVNQYNDWMTSSDDLNKKKEHKENYFIQGLLSFLYIFRINPKEKNPNNVYSSTNLTEKQIYAIENAANWKRTSQSLEDEISNGRLNKDLTKEKEIIQNMYDKYKSIYISEKI